MTHPIHRPPRGPIHLGDIHYTAEQINTLLGMIPFKADRAEVPEIEKLSDVNYLGHVADATLLTAQAQPSWALVGSLKDAKPYFYYVEGFVPQGYQAGWNDVSAALGTYDLTSDKVSIYDFHLLTEYNVSHNHTHTTKVFSKDWGITRKFYPEYPDYLEGLSYQPCSKVNMPGYKEHSFMANKQTSEAPFTTVQGTNEFSFEEAISIVPEEYRFAGMRVTFINNMTHQAETWYFNGGTWGNVGNWQKIDFGVGEDQLTAEELFKEKFEMPKLLADMALCDEHGNRIPDTYLTRQAVNEYIQSIYQDLFIANPPLIIEGYITPDMLSESVKDMLAAAGATITNLPDEEDITQKNKVLKLADKQYNPGAYSGLGRCYLRKNLVAGQNILTQDMIKEPNTIYIIQYDYNLQGAAINIPEGCVLDFQGGSIDNGRINADKTKIIANKRQIFGDNLTVNQSWMIDYAYPEWFGADSFSENDSYFAITKAFAMCLHVKLSSGTYYISHPIRLDIRYKLEGEKEKTIITPHSSVELMDCILYVASEWGYAYGFIKDLFISGGNKAEYGIKCYYVTADSVIENLRIVNCKEAGVYLTRCWYACFRNIASWSNKYGMYLEGHYGNTESELESTDAINGVKFDSCWLNLNSENALFVNRGGSAISFSSCTFENSQGNAEINIKDLYNDISFYSCYWETRTKMIESTPSYDRAGVINIFGGILHQNNDNSPYIKTGIHECINLIGCVWRNTGNESTALPLIDVSGTTVLATGALPISNQSFNNEANVLLIGSANNWNQVWRNLNTRSFSANMLSALSNEPRGSKSTAKIEVGASQLIDVSPEYGAYRLETILDKESNSFVAKVLYNYGNSVVESNVLKIGQWGDVEFLGRVKANITPKRGPSTSRPALSLSHLGTMYFDTDLGKPIWMSLADDGYSVSWIDATGAEV